MTSLAEPSSAGRAAEVGSRISRPRGLAALAAAAALGVATPAEAHPLDPALLVLTEIGAGRWDVRWRHDRSPSEAGASRGDLEPVLPDHCRPGPRVGGGEGAASRWTLDCGERGLAGQPVSVRGPGASRTDVVVEVVPIDAAPATVVLRPGDPPVPLPAGAGGHASAARAAASYAALGVRHILAGADHLLFLAGLLLIVRGVRDVVVAVTAFTAAHSVTLALAVLGLVRVPPAPVEALVAGSVVLVAAAAARRAGAPPTLVGRRPAVAAFALGLLHGLAFAGALAEAGIAPRSVPLALASFNAGVEVGQVAFVLGALGAAAVARRAIARRPPGSARAAVAYAVGSAGAFLCLDRIAALGG